MGIDIWYLGIALGFSWSLYKYALYSNGDILL